MIGTRRVLLAVIVVASSLGLAACGTAPLALTATVPWRPIPATPTTTTTTTTTTLAPAPPCKASQMRARKAFGGAATGNLATLVVLTNTGSTCRLAGYPTLIGISHLRGRARLAAKHGTFFGNLIPTDLTKGQSGRLMLGTEDGCNALNTAGHAVIERNMKENTYAEVEIIFPRGEGSLTTTTYPFDVACGLDESELGTYPPSAFGIPTPPGSPGSLTATVRLPRTARSGEVLTYTVSLHNPTDVAVDLHSCPNYTEAMYYRRPVTRTYTLNCTRARPIRPGQTRIFQMKLPIPKVAQSTLAKFSWQLDTGLGPYAGGVLQLIPANGVLYSAHAMALACRATSTELTSISKQPPSASYHLILLFKQSYFDDLRFSPNAVLREDALPLELAVKEGATSRAIRLLKQIEAICGAD